MIAANETESKWWICDCCCRFITLRRHVSNILYLWKSAQWQMIKVHKKCRIDDILIKENPFFFDRTTSNVPVDGSCTKWSRSYDSQFRVLHRHYRSWWYESLRRHYNICKGVHTVINLSLQPWITHHPQPVLEIHCLWQFGTCWKWCKFNKQHLEWALCPKVKKFDKGPWCLFK